MKRNHPFSGRRGSAIRTEIAQRKFVEQRGLCAMCGDPIDPTLRGTKDPSSAVLDHIKPWRLRPDLSFDESNLHLIDRKCHSVCESIEDRLWPDEDAIEREKALPLVRASDGWR